MNNIFQKDPELARKLLRHYLDKNDDQRLNLCLDAISSDDETDKEKQIRIHLESLIGQEFYYQELDRQTNEYKVYPDCKVKILTFQTNGPKTIRMRGLTFDQAEWLHTRFYGTLEYYTVKGTPRVVPFYIGIHLNGAYMICWEIPPTNDSWDCISFDQNGNLNSTFYCQHITE